MYEEWLSNLLENRQDLNQDALSRTIHAMNESVLDCIVGGYQDLIENLVLPDPDDRHVLAAAIVARANVIVTFNTKDFPKEKIERFGLHAKHPDEFFLDLSSIDNDEFVAAAMKDLNHYASPTLTFENYISGLRKARIPQTADYINQFKILMT